MGWYSTTHEDPDPVFWKTSFHGTRRRWREGDDAAGNVLASHVVSLVAYLVARTLESSSPQEREDAVQDIVMEITKVMRGETAIENPKSFVGTVTRRRLLDWMRGKYRKQAHGACDGIEEHAHGLSATDPSPREAAEAEELLTQVLERAQRRVKPPEKWNLWYLSRVLDMKVREAANAAKVKFGNAGRWMSEVDAVVREELTLGGYHA